MTDWACHTMANTPLYSFENKKLWGRVLSVHDGDTMTCAIEAYPGCFFRYNVRLCGIDTSEMSGPCKTKAIESRNELISFITNGEIHMDREHTYKRNDIISLFSKDIYLVYLECSKMDKYGRILANVYPPGDFQYSANQMLRDKGLAHEYDGGHKEEELA